MRSLLHALILGLLCIPAVHAEQAELPAGVRSVLQVRDLPADSLSIYIENVETGETLLQWLDEEPRNPASTIKLLTTLVALDVLGPAYRWKTDVYARGELTGDSLAGDLVLKGYGDPFLVTERVWQLLRNIRRAGIREITGDLLIDDSYFDVGDYDPCRVRSAAAACVQRCTQRVADELQGRTLLVRTGS